MLALTTWSKRLWGEMADARQALRFDINPPTVQASHLSLRKRAGVGPTAVAYDDEVWCLWG